MSEERKIRNDIVAIGILALIIFLSASMVTYDQRDPAHQASSWLNQIYQPDQLFYPPKTEWANACGRLGAWTADMLSNTLGIGAYFVIFGLVGLEIALFKRQSLESPWLKTGGWTLGLIGITTLASVALPTQWFSPMIGPGGYLGALFGGLFMTYLGSVGCFVASISMLVVGMMMSTEYLVFRTGRVVFAPAVVAAAAVLPFGVLHGFMKWFNGVDVEDQTDEQSKEFADTMDPDEEEGEDEEDADGPRTIRFRRRDIDQTEEEVIGADVEDEAEELEDEEDDELEDAVAEDDGEIFDEVEEDLDAVEVAATTKAPDPTAEEPEKSAPVPKPHFKIRKPKPAKEPSEREVVMSQLNAAVAAAETIENYELPSIHMLETAKEVPFEQQKREALKKAEILELTCKQFGYDVKVVEIETGPVISQYEIDLAPGLRLQKITALADDLAIAMRVPSVRIVAPIPGKNSVGVEVPNETRQVVNLRQVMEQSEKQIKKMKIPLFLGSDAVGAPMVADLAALPHLLIAGRTGTGKSVCLNAIISSILMTRRPDEVRMLMIDPKMVELSGYGTLPHLMHPVVTDMRKAEAMLAWAVEKMDERYTLLAKVGVRHVTSYNQMDREDILDKLGASTEEEIAAVPEKLPFIVIVADEIADMMMTAGKDVEKHIIRIAQKSRAVGIHLILATQKPTVDVITGLIKSNLPARISFQVASKMDSRVVLDAQGADKLLGMGDMLFLWPGTSNLLRGQGTYLSDPEINKITEVCSTGEQNFVHELVNIKVKEEEEEGDDATPKKLENRDPLYKQAITIVVQEQRGSCSLLQRAMGIGYGRAARLIDFMAEDGYVGQYNGSKAREVMLSEEQWANIQNGDPNPVNDEDWPEEEGDTATAVAPPLEPMSKPVSKIEADANEDDQQDDDSQTGEIEITHQKSPSRVRRPKLKSLRKDLGKSSHIAANSTAPPESETLDDETEEEEYDEIEGDEFEQDHDAVDSVDDDVEYEYEYEDGDYEDDEDLDDDDYDEDDYDEEEYEDVD
jgi:S-DNA-T family DNA segregation ATPase FtsK/SpoIIIE